eukprot:TRINITY_DN58724_c0_g1_i1.p1 TRINITY_DN58724_c0_g1~~TRINITY_DN58724_c0_g1_i1.p1  ORF type:complete len:482 (+),score=35.35 TRINITY_DN58724_c0_g1_i1:47-1447(+)
MVCGCSRRTDGLVDVNVGGEKFNKIAIAVVNECPTLKSVAKQSRDGSLFVDRNGKLYEFIIPFLATGTLKSRPEDFVTCKMLMREAEFLGLTDLVGILNTNLSASVPSNESERLMRLNTFFGAASRQTLCLDHITRVLALLHNAPMALISFVDRDRQVCVSRLGFPYETRPRSYSFCAHALVADSADEIQPLVVNNTLLDHRFQNNPLVVNDPLVRSYAGAPLVTYDGYRLGALCTMDTKPNQRSTAQLQLLMNLSHLVMQEIERDQIDDDDSTNDSHVLNEEPNFTSSELRLLRMQQAVKGLVALVHVGIDGALDYRLLYTNSIWSQTVGVVLTPPSTISENATAIGEGVHWPFDKPPDVGPLLWHWLQLENESEDEFDERLRGHWKQSSGGSTTLVFRGILRCAPGLPRQRMIGRVVDADAPLDVSVSVAAGSSGADVLVREAAEEKPEDGRFVFIILHPMCAH